MTTRHLRNLARQPWWIAITLVQPIIWLLLFGAVFKATADIPGFAADSYVDFLTPGPGRPGRPVRRLHLAGHPRLPCLPARHLTPLRRRE